MTHALLLLLACGPALPPAPEVKVEKVWDRAPHNAFTDLARFRGRWYCTFREGKGHAAGAGEIRVLVSATGEKWEPAALVSKEGVDLRDPHLSVTPDGRLMLVGGAAEPASRDPVKDHYSFVSFSKDGKEWTAPARVLDSWQWLWRVTWHKGTAYGVAYGWDPKAPGQTRAYKASLHRSKDGLKWDKAADFDVPNATEAALAFEGDTMLCLQRRDGKPNTAMLGVSRPPYREWAWKDLGAYLGGPQLGRAPDGAWWAAGRRITKEGPRTVVGRLDVEKGTFTPTHTLPSGGDTSYPGMVFEGGEWWVSYYSSHEGRSSIYLARVPAGDKR